MLKNFTLPQATGAPDQKLLANVESHGWHVVGVLEEGDLPPFSFSVGLYYRFEQPEILIMGLAATVACSIINEIGDMMARGETIMPGRPYSDVLASHDVYFVQISQANYKEYLGRANWFYRSINGAFPALQMVWPDNAGLFPWQSGYNERLAFQVLLGDPPARGGSALS